MAKVAVLMAQGFEDAETIVTLDVLRRAKLDVELLACADDPVVTSYFKVLVRADALLAERSGVLFDAIVLPGGPQGARNLGADPAVVACVKAHQAAGRWVAALCSAGAHVLAANGLLEGRRYTCSGNNHALYADGQYVDADIVEDRGVLTGRGLGLAFQFAFNLADRLAEPGVAARQAEHIYVDFQRQG
ncbi:MAG: DJ-1/PfpI family protein [Candidatus Dactylopiibacterium sp.]|nr:DJ-1/PfpI family protein [Candidatus Dactylopiibacterium sp.]